MGNIIYIRSWGREHYTNKMYFFDCVLSKVIY